jgi:predicted nucleic acid-binding protein
MAVIDTSVYVAIVKATEPHHQISRKWFQETKLNGEQISAPVIFLAEVAAAIGRGQDDTELVKKVVQTITDQKLIELFPISFTMAERAAVIAAEQRIRGADALYVALAEHLGDELVTWDEQQRLRGAAVVTTRLP